ALTCLGIMVAGMGLSALCTALAPLVAVRLLTGVGIGAMMVVINPIAVEVANRRTRSFAVAMMSVGYPLGSSLPLFPMDPASGEFIDIIELPMQFQDLSLTTPPYMATTTAEQAKRHHGVAHYLFHQYHLHSKPDVAEAYIDDAQIHVAVMEAAEMPKPILPPPVM
ncbi:MAG: hypothetical protein FWJ87_15635, partial [Micromonosporaceae bacterium]